MENGICSTTNCGQDLVAEFPSGNALHSGGSQENAAWFALGLDNQGNIQQPDAQYCRDAVTNGINASICSGDQLNLNNGQVNSCLQELKQLCDQKKAEATPSCTTSNPWMVNIPVIHCNDLVSGNPVQQAPAVGFVRMGITDANFQGNPKTVDFGLTAKLFPIPLAVDLSVALPPSRRF